MGAEPHLSGRASATPGAVEAVFGPHGVLSRHFEGYVPRSGQLQMARAVEAALARDERVLIEAPTGTGKGMAYAAPASHYAATRKKRVVIATANIALQEQLITKDLPLLEKLLPWNFSYALLKGKQNFLCRDQVRLINHGLTVLPKAISAVESGRMLRWAETTSTGDRSELSFEPSRALWREFSTTTDECRGKECPHIDDCFFYEAKRRASEADIVVVNCHLLLAHARYGNVLPPFDALIVDEAHELADIARDVLGEQINEGATRRIEKALFAIEQRSLATTLGAEAGRFFELLSDWAEWCGAGGRLRTPYVVDPRPLCRSLLRAAVALEDAASEDARELTHVARRAEKLSARLERALSLEDDNTVTFVESAGSARRLAICTKPVGVSGYLQESLWSQSSAAILTSATLTVGGSFERVKTELGLGSSTTLSVESPFDFRKAALLVVPQGLPSPSDREFPEAVAQAVASVVELARGRTLALFTSYRNLNRTYETLRHGTRRVLRQGNMPRTELIREFAKDTHSVLLGTDSFWTGVDVPGQSLSCVVIDRLPFPAPGDPVGEAIAERVKNGFEHHQLARAVVKFKQGFGRLIRSASDRGVVVVLDQRLVTKSYGEVFLQSLPQVLKSRRLESIREFLGERD